MKFVIIVDSLMTGRQVYGLCETESQAEAYLRSKGFENYFGKWGAKNGTRALILPLSHIQI